MIEQGHRDKSDKICLHLPHACIIIAENVGRLNWDAEGDFRVSQGIIRRYFCILLYYTEIC